MALTVYPTFTSVSSDGTTSVITDSTTYGSPNQDRADVAVYLKAYKVSELLVETALTVATFDPETVTSFTVTNGADGRHKFYFVIIDNYAGGTTYTKYDLVWDTTQNAFYEYINASDTSGNAVTDTAYWSVVADPTTKIANVGTALESGNLNYAVIEKIIDYQTAKCWGNAAILVAKSCCDCQDDCQCDARLKKSESKIHSLLTAMRICDTRLQYLQGERFALQAIHYCGECGCLEQ